MTADATTFPSIVTSNPPAILFPERPSPANAAHLGRWDRAKKQNRDISRFDRSATRAYLNARDHGATA